MTPSPASARTGSAEARGTTCEPPNLQEVVRQAHELPFACHILQTTQQELPEASNVFDLTKDWLNDPIRSEQYGASRRSYKHQLDNQDELVFRQFSIARC